MNKQHPKIWQKTGCRDVLPLTYQMTLSDLQTTQKNKDLHRDLEVERKITRIKTFPAKTYLTFNR